MRRSERVKTKEVLSSNLRAVIWDKDGVLMDTETVYFPAYRDAVVQFGNGKLEYDWETHMQYAGNPSTETFLAVRKKYGLEVDRDTFLKVYRAGYMAYIKKNGLDPLPGVIELLQNLKNEGIELGVGTGASRPNADLTLEKAGIAHFFDAVVTATDVARGKPDPEVFIRVAELLKVRPDECAVIEDSRNGFIAAKAAGMKLVGIKDHTYSVDSDLAVPDLIVNSLTEITVPILKAL